MKTIENRIDDLETKMDTITDTLNFLKRHVEKGSKIETVECESSRRPTMEEKYSSLTCVEKKKIENIMENFDFPKVQSVMDYLDWTWYGTKNGVPDVDEIRECAKGLLVDAAYEKSQVSSGGLCAMYEKDRGCPEDPFIQLEFVLTECEGFDED